MTKKALFLSGGWEGHEPQETSEFISNAVILLFLSKFLLKAFKNCFF